MANNSSGKFFFGSIVIFLIIAGVVAVVLNNMQSLAANVLPPESMEEDAVAERIQPVAQVHVGEAPEVAEAPAEDDMQVNRGQQIVESVCAVCHATGMMESPRTNRAADWAPRLEQGIETVYANAINGLGMMPPRGGRPDLSDDDIKAAVDYMIADLK